MPNNLKVGSIFFEMDIDALGNLQNPAPLCLKCVHVCLRQESTKASAISHAYSYLFRPPQVKQTFTNGWRQNIPPEIPWCNLFLQAATTEGLTAKIGLAQIEQLLTNQNRHWGQRWSGIPSSTPSLFLDRHSIMGCIWVEGFRDLRQ